MTFKSFNPPCDTLNLSWYENFQLPQYRTVDVVGIKILKTGDILFKNVNGQIINLARDVGTDKENVKGLKDSFISQGWDTSKVPPIVDESDLSLFDGFSRHEALLDIDQQYGFYLVVRRKSQFSIDDVIDEIGLGANNHSQAKKANMGDFKKRFTRWVMRKQDEGEELTLNDGRQWFASIPHSFSEENIDKAIVDVFNTQKASENMEAFDKPAAEEKAAELLNSPKNEVFAINKGATKKGGYMKKVITDVIYYYSKTGKIPEVVGFLNKIPAENSTKKRKELETEIELINDAFSGLLQEKKKNPSFKLINFKGHLPQVIGKETKLVKH